MQPTSLPGGDAPVCTDTAAAKRAELVAVVERDLAGAPIHYVWGGDDSREAGLDCSGYVVVLCRELGLDLVEAAGRTTDDFHRKLERVEAPAPGDLALYGTGKKADPANHVMVVLGEGLDGQRRVAGMSGGGRWATSIQASKERNPPARLKAFSHHLYRKDFLGFYRLPFAGGGKAA